MITQDDFKDWLSQPVTKAVFEAVQLKIDGLKSELAGSAGLDTRNDGIKVGAISAFVDILDTSFEEVQND